MRTRGLRLAPCHLHVDPARAALAAAAHPHAVIAGRAERRVLLSLSTSTSHRGIAECSCLVVVHLTR